MSGMKAVILQKNNISGKVKSGMLNLCGTVQRASGGSQPPPTPTGGGYVLSNIPVTIIQTEGASSS